MLIQSHLKLPTTSLSNKRAKLRSPPGPEKMWISSAVRCLGEVWDSWRGVSVYPRCCIFYICLKYFFLYLSCLYLSWPQVVGQKALERVLKQHLANLINQFSLSFHVNKWQAIDNVNCCGQQMPKIHWYIFNVLFWVFVTSKDKCLVDFGNLISLYACLNTVNIDIVMCTSILFGIS